MTRLPTEFPQPPGFYQTTKHMEKMIRDVQDCAAYMRLFGKPEAAERYTIIEDQIREHLPTVKSINDNLWAYYNIVADQGIPVSIVDFASKSLVNLEEVTDRLALMYQKQRQIKKREEDEKTNCLRRLVVEKTDKDDTPKIYLEPKK